MRTGYFQAKTARYGAGRRWRCRYLDPDGKERSKSFERRADAERFRSQAAADVARGTYVDPGAGRMTLRTYAEGWLKGWHPYSGRGEKVRSHLELHILPGLGGHTLAQLTPTAVRQWLAGLPLAPGAARQVFITLSAVLSAAVDDGRLARNPCKAKSVQAPSQPHQKIIPWTAAQVRAVRSELPERYRAMADCGAGLGLRQGEVLGGWRWTRSTSCAMRSMSGGRSSGSPAACGSRCPRAAGKGRCRCPRRWRSRWRRTSWRTRQLR